MQSRELTRCVNNGHGLGATQSPRPALETRFKPPARLAARLPASHMTVSQAGPNGSNDAVATVLIIGASRGIGFETMKAALEAGHSVRALARSARRIPVDHPKLEKMAGDALEMATVKRALTGVDVVTQSLGLPAGPEIILKADVVFLQSDASARHRDGGGSSQAVDLRDGLRDGR
jgi:NAD(P)H-binding